MFTHILIPTDLSDRADRVIEVVRDLATTPDARITVLHVIETIPGTSFEEFQSFYRELEKRAAERLAAAAARLERGGHPVGQAVVYGKRADEIVRFAVDQQVDLIVLTSHAVDLSRSAYGWGTLSYRVGILAPCAVLLVK